MVVALLFVTLPFVVRAVQPVLLELDREMEQAAESLGASRSTVFRRIILPNLLPAILAGAGLAFARAVGEFGSLVLITGNIPFKTQVASVFIFCQVESDNIVGAAAVSVVLLVVSLVGPAAVRLALEARRCAMSSKYGAPLRRARLPGAAARDPGRADLHQRVPGRDRRRLGRASPRPRRSTPSSSPS